MFTGIIQSLGRLVAAGEHPRLRRLRVQTGFQGLAVGESVAVDGVCLTVSEISGADEASFDVSTETLERTTLGGLAEGSALNLERAVGAGERFSGHIVQGHVDGVGRLLSLKEDGECRVLEFSLPAALVRYCVPKGSLAVSGISLTLNSVSDPVAPGGEGAVSVMVIPHTLRNTTLGALLPGQAVNLEVDILAKYVERLCPPR